MRGDEGPGAVFAVVRRRLREVNWHHTRSESLAKAARRASPVVPAAYGGWLHADAAEWSDSDGLVPLGALIDRLLAVMESARLSDLESMALVAWYGLERVPFGHGGDEGAIGALLAPNAATEFGRQDVAVLRRRAISKLSGQMRDRRSDTAVGYGPTPDPCFSPWFARLSMDTREACWERAETASLDLIAVGPIQSGRRRRLYAELGRYLATARHEAGDLTHRKGLARAVSVMSVALWREVKVATQDVGPPAGGGRLLPAGVPVLPRSRPVRGRPGGADAGDVVTGRSRDPGLAPSLIDLTTARQLLQAGAPAPRLLLDVSNLFRVHEDWETVTIARLMLTRCPTAAETITACMNGAMVASAHHHFSAAKRLLIGAERAARSMTPRDVCDLSADRREFLHAIFYGHSAATRRLAESALLGATWSVDDVIGRLHPRRPDGWARMFGLGLASDAERILEDEDTPTMGGDADLTWPARAHLRHAEFLQIAALAAMTDRRQRADGEAWLQSADRKLDRVRALMAEEPHNAAAYAHQVRKAELFQAILHNDAAEAERAGVRLVSGGWSIYRSVLPVTMLLFEPARHPNPALPRWLRSTAVIGRDAGLAAETGAVPDTFRRNSYAAMRFRPRRKRKATP